MQSRQLPAPYHLHSCRAAQQSAQLHDAHSNFKSLLCAVPSVEGSRKAAISLLTYAQQTTGCTVPPNYHQRIVICKMSLAHAKPLLVMGCCTSQGCVIVICKMSLAHAKSLAVCQHGSNKSEIQKAGPKGPSVKPVAQRQSAAAHCRAPRCRSGGHREAGEECL